MFAWVIIDQSETEFSTMPANNQFRHQLYTSSNPIAPYHILSEVTSGTDDGARMQNVGKILRRARVSKIYLVHGTFAGEDPFGALGNLQLLFPRTMIYRLLSLNKQLTDLVTRDGGNYTQKFVNEFNTRIGATDIVDRFLWGSQNNRVDRANGTIRLLHSLLELGIDAGNERVLLWGHSHAGNVFAIITNLLANDPEKVGVFFEAGRLLFPDETEWTEVERHLGRSAGPHPLSQSLDIVTFGTPIRYGWDTRGYAKLLHFIHHRPVRELKEWQAPAPWGHGLNLKELIEKVTDMFTAKYGDWVQSFAVAGTDTSIPGQGTDRRQGEIKLSGLLEEGLEDAPEPEAEGTDESFKARLKKRIDQLEEIWQRGMRVHHDGTTLLVDYGTDEKGLLGHAVYTKEVWVPFHAEQTVKRLYAE